MKQPTTIVTSCSIQVSGDCNHFDPATDADEKLVFEEYVASVESADSRGESLKVQHHTWLRLSKIE